MKERVMSYLLAAVKRIGALWIGFLLAMIPIYACRASIHDINILVVTEPIVTSSVVLLSAAVVLYFLYRGDDRAAKADPKGISGMILMPTLIHALVCVITAFTTNLTVISTGMGYAVLELLEPAASGIAGLSVGVKLLAAVVVPPIPALGAWLGCLSAQKKRRRQAEELHRTKT